MFDKTVKAIDTEMVIFSSQDYDGDVEAFQDAVNSWLKSQPDNIAIEDIIYRHCGVTSRGKDIFSMVIISMPIPKNS
tara:strand:- start:111 stop:341 length:231 start_codon:yes stop_codon:yes gene_type:complete